MGLITAGVGRRPTLRQLFSTYPYGGAGFGLLLMRFTLGIVGLVEGMHFVTGAVALPWQCLGGVLAASGAFVSMGLFTSFAGVAAAVSAALLTLLLVPLPTLSLLDRPLGTAIVVALGIAVALLGPGAFSLDFRLFGYREIIIPRGGSSATLQR